MLVNDIKKALRIAHDRLDDDIQQHISACLDDMRRLGIAVPDNDTDVESNSLLLSAVKLYCMAQYDFLSKGDQYKKGYESLRDVLSMSSGYKESDEDV